MRDEVDELFDSPVLREVAPQIAAAWADALLTPAELTQVERRARRVHGATEADLDTLRSWLDPAAPPSPRALARLENGLRMRRPTQRALVLEEPTPAQAAEGEIPQAISLRARRLQAVLDGKHAYVRAQVRRLLALPELTLPASEDRAVYRAQVLAWLKLVGEILLTSTEGKGEGTIEEFIAAFEVLAYHDLSLVVKVGVQFGLFCGALEQLGTEKHAAILERARKLEMIGCFAMTERAHGSNVRDLQTEAHYDRTTGGYFLHTPSLSAGKEWIGNAALHASHAVVFAQLYVGTDCHGVHAFVVQLRKPDGSLCESVRIEDCGGKLGLNGVDNGRIWFDRVALPAEALLDRFGRVDAQGVYQSEIPSPSRRFFTMLGTLVRGRIAVCGASISAGKTGLAIALSYAEHRRQLPSGGPERRLIEYPYHRRRLLPHLAALYGLTFAQAELVEKLGSAKTGSDHREVEELAAGLKALATERAVATLQAARECCGGQGYLSENRIAALRADADVFTTFEGDNAVLLQLMAKGLLTGSASAGLRGAAQLMTRWTKLRADLWRQRMRPRSLLPATLLRDRPVKLAILLDWLTMRVDGMSSAVSARLAVALARGKDAQDAFDMEQTSAILYARAHTELLVARAFVARAEQHADLRELAELHLVDLVLNDAGWLLGEGVLGGRDVRRLRVRRSQLEADIGARSMEFVHAFGIPAASLGPLADESVLIRSGLIL